MMTTNAHALDAFRPNEDTPDNGADPQAVLYATQWFAGCPLHVWAISVEQRPDRQCAENPDYQSDLDCAQRMIGGHHGPFSTVAYRGRDYAIVSIPHGLG